MTPVIGGLEVGGSDLERNPLVSSNLSNIPQSGPRAYTSAVLRMFQSLGFLLASASIATAQVRIVLPKRQYKVEEQIQARLENKGTHPITVCVQFGQWWPKGMDLEFVPTPFVREWNRKWQVARSD